MGILVALYFLRRTARKGGSIFLGGGYDLHRNYGIVVILLSFLCNYDNFDTKVTSKKNAATMMKDKFLLADSKLEVYQE